MAQVFRRRMNTIARVGFVTVLLILPLTTLFGTYGVLRSSWQTKEGLFIGQTIPFSHEHHVRGLGIDCRYCHTGVESSAYAGIPATKTCMTCHSRVWLDSPLLAPVRTSWDTGQPLVWNKVNVLPDYVYFDHSIHVQKGVGCTECHGQVDAMPLMKKGASLQMRWCLECHRHPEDRLRPRGQVFNMAWTPPADQRQAGLNLVHKYHVDVHQIQNCSVCHR